MQWIQNIVAHFDFHHATSTEKYFCNGSSMKHASFVLHGESTLTQDMINENWEPHLQQSWSLCLKMLVPELRFLWQ